MTFKDLIKTLESFAEEHAMIQSFGWGDSEKISTKDRMFPMLWVQPRGLTPLEGGRVIQNCDIIIMDLQKQDDSNLLYSMSSMGLIGIDLVSEFQQSQTINGFEIDENNWIANPFSGEYDEYTDGFLFNIDFHYPQTLNKCIIPKNE